MDAWKIQEMIEEAIYEADNDEQNVRDISSYENAGIMTTDKGLVMRMEDGSEFQITIVQSR